MLNQYAQLLKILYLTNTNAILMKLARTMYLPKIFDLAKNWGINQRASECVNKKHLRIRKKIRFLP